MSEHKHQWDHSGHCVVGFGTRNRCRESLSDAEIRRRLNAFDALVEALEECEWAGAPDTDYNGDFCPFCYVTSRPHRPHCSRAAALRLARGESEVRA